MSSVRLRALACALAVAVLSGCGGGGGGGDAGGDNTLHVSLSYENATVPLFGESAVTPTTSGFEGRSPICSLASGSLPAGMALHSNCSISGRPTKAGPFPFHVKVRVAGFSGSVDVSTSVWVASPVIGYDDHTRPELPVGTALNDLPKVTGWTRPEGVTPVFRYTLKGGDLPPGVSFDATTGRIAGTIGAQGAFRAEIDATMTTAFGTYQLPATTYAVNADVETFSYTDYDGTGSVDGFFQAWAGVDYTSIAWTQDRSATLSAFRILSGTLPAGLTVDPANGTVWGVPQAITAPATVGVGATVTLFGVSNATQADFKVRVDAPSVIGWGTPATVPITVPFTLGIERRDVVAFQGRLDVVATPRPGACLLPPGLSMAANGYVSGTPTVAGAFDCTVDFSLSLNGASWTQQGKLTLTVR